jgi:MFS transporter, FSR family, fosmidomycin resistance protein
MFDDISQGALPVMLPFFIIAHNLSYSAAAGLVMAVTIGSSFLQPILGQFADRHSAPWLVPAGILLAGGGVALGTVMPTYLLIVLAIGLSGIGVAAFHPEGSRFANRASGSRQATGMSIFSLGGNLGFAIGPLLATTLMMNFGLHGGLLLAVPAVAMSLIMATQLSRFVPPPHPSTGKVAASRPIRPDAWGSFARLTGVVLSRSIVFYGLNTFIPLYWRDVLHQPIATGGVALTILLSSGAAGTILGGLLADKYGRRTVVLAGMAACTPLLFALVSLQDATLATMLLVPLGLALYAPMSVMVVMGQEYLPNRIGTASGVTMGLAVGVGGLSAPLLGQVADTSGMQAVLNLLVFLPLISFAFAATLPNRKLRPAS